MAVVQQYDYIIAGAGCAGLSLAMHMLRENALEGKQLLIVEKEDKTSNDRTWCFWEEDIGLFESIVLKEWKHLFVRSDSFDKKLDIHPFIYKMIRGIDFYQYCFDTLRQHANIHFINGEAGEIESDGKSASVEINGTKFQANWLFNSIMKRPILKNNEYWLLQHFMGWTIEYDRDVFDPETATIMDFNTDQSNGTTFFYVLPLNKRKALVEYTLFSEKLLPREEYKQKLHHYISRHFGQQYTILDDEFGVIPMTNHPFRKQQGNVIHIGSAGGQTKGSSGYTFQSIQRSSSNIAKNLSANRRPLYKARAGKRFLFYDAVLLRILTNRSYEGASIFQTMFDRNRPEDVLRFLDNGSSLSTDIRILSSLPVLPFSRAAIGHLLSW